MNCTIFIRFRDGGKVKNIGSFHYLVFYNFNEQRVALNIQN